jgi:hypothetical protein
VLARLVAARDRPADSLWELWPYVAVVFLPFALIMATLAFRDLTR